MTAVVTITLIMKRFTLHSNNTWADSEGDRNTRNVLEIEDLALHMKAGDGFQNSSSYILKISIGAF